MLLTKLEKQVAEVKVEDLPDIIGDLAKITALANKRWLMGGAGQSSADEGHEILNVKEVAERFKRSTDWVYEECHAANDPMPHHRKGKGKITCLTQDVDAWYARKFSMRSDAHL